MAQPAHSNSLTRGRYSSEYKSSNCSSPNSNLCNNNNFNGSRFNSPNRNRFSSNNFNCNNHRSSYTKSNNWNHCDCNSSSNSKRKNNSNRSNRSGYYRTRNWFCIFNQDLSLGGDKVFAARTATGRFLPSRRRSQTGLLF